MFNHEDIRIFLQDYQSANRLLDNVEFTPEQIDKGIIDTIRTFNDIPPVAISYTENNAQLFPFKNLLLTGVVSYLLRGKGLERTRNRLPHQTDGISIDDQGMADTYLQMGSTIRAEFKDQARQIKLEININDGFGSVSSEYRYLPYSTWGNI